MSYVWDGLTLCTNTVWGWPAGIQLWRKGPANHGEQKIDHQPAVSPGTEGGHLHLGLYWRGCSQQIKGCGSFPTLSTFEINSVVLHPVLGSRDWMEHKVYEEKLKALGLNNSSFELKALRRKSWEKALIALQSYLVGDRREDGGRFLFEMKGYEKHKVLHGKFILDVRKSFIYF